MPEERPERVRRTRFQMLKDQETVARMRYNGAQEIEIAQALGYSQPTASRDIAKIVARWEQSIVGTMDDMRRHELAKLDMMEEELMEQFERSKADYTKKVIEEGSGGKAGSKKGRIETGSQIGDPRFIQAMLGVQDRRAKLIGMDAPSQSELQLNGVIATATFDATGMSDATLAELMEARRNVSAAKPQ